MIHTHTHRRGRENGKQVHTMNSVGLRDSEGAANTGWCFWSDIRGVGELPSQSQQGWGQNTGKQMDGLIQRPETAEIQRATLSVAAHIFLFLC